jgi:glycosyltransferase involved in cell wall biosynthesis
VGGDFERKGGDVVLEVFRSHLRGRAELDIVTRAPLDEEAGVRVHHGLTARSPRLLALYEKATAFVLPTQADCFSIASIEAMAMGLPVVASGVGGIPEIIESGRTGFLVAPRNGQEFREAVERLLANPTLARGMGLRGRSVVEERFDAKKTAEHLFGLLATILRGPARPK